LRGEGKLNECEYFSGSMLGRCAVLESYREVQVREQW